MAKNIAKVDELNNMNEGLIDTLEELRRDFDAKFTQAIAEDQQANDKVKEKLAESKSELKKLKEELSEAKKDIKN